VLRRNRQKRHRFREIFVEGVRPINTALEHGWTITAIYYAAERQLSDWARGIIERANPPVQYRVTPNLMAQLSEKEETSELVVLMSMPEDDLTRIPITDDSVIVLFDRPVSPGNLGTMIRSCDALRATGLILSGHGADLYDPETIRASRGSLFALPCVRVGGPDDVRSWLEAARASHSMAVTGTDEGGSIDLWDASFEGAQLLLLGNETWGLSAAYKEMCDAMVRIPMTGSASSLNVANAGSILLYEMLRQRHHAINRPRS
jgi:TrmH family RNA methyltransferase